MTGTKMTSDAALATGPELLKLFGTWSNLIAKGQVRADGVIVVETAPRAAPRPRKKAA